MGTWEIFKIFDLAHGDTHLFGDLLAAGSRPYSWTNKRETRMILLIVSVMCTGIRMVRAWSAMERVIAWRIHHVAYVENL